MGYLLQFASGSLDKEKNISINQIELYDTNVNFFDSNSSFDINTKKTNLKISNFNLKKDVVTIGQILLKEPKIDILNMESKLKIEAKNINLDLRATCKFNPHQVANFSL